MGQIRVTTTAGGFSCCQRQKRRLPFYGYPDAAKTSVTLDAAGAIERFRARNIIVAQNSSESNNTPRECSWRSQHHGLINASVVNDAMAGLKREQLLARPQVSHLCTADARSRKTRRQSAAVLRTGYLPWRLPARNNEARMATVLRS